MGTIPQNRALATAGVGSRLAADAPPSGNCGQRGQRKSGFSCLTHPGVRGMWESQSAAAWCSGLMSRGAQAAVRARMRRARRVGRACRACRACRAGERMRRPHVHGTHGRVGCGSYSRPRKLLACSGSCLLAREMGNADDVRCYLVNRRLYTVISGYIWTACACLTSIGVEDANVATTRTTRGVSHAGEVGECTYCGTRATSCT